MLFRKSHQCTACSVLIMGFILSLLVSGSADPQPIARIAAIQNIVEIKHGNAPYHKAEARAPLSIGDTVRTGRRSKLDIKFKNNSLVRLGQQSEVEITSATELKVLRGQVMVSSCKDLQVLKAPATAMICD